MNFIYLVSYFSSGAEVNIDNYDQPNTELRTQVFYKAIKLVQSNTHDKETVKPILTVKSC